MRTKGRTMRNNGSLMNGQREKYVEQWRTMIAKGNIRWNNDRNKENNG